MEFKTEEQAREWFDSSKWSNPQLWQRYPQFDPQRVADYLYLMCVSDSCDPDRYVKVWREYHHITS